MRILVTGGAGYIGSHVVKALVDRGDTVMVVDSLIRGHREAVEATELIVADLADHERVAELLQSFKPDAVMHFAAFIEVGESVRKPARYYGNNTANTLSLLNLMTESGIDRFIFSSTAAVYGQPDVTPIPESAPLSPINPYGWSKRFVEQALSDMSATNGMHYVSLRYFNAAGADPGGSIGESHDPETHLIPLVLQAAAGKRDRIAVFGDDYPTPDGTCVRDYIHVTDLAEAHLLALDHLMDNGDSRVYNCGYGKGYSVKEVIDTAKEMAGRDFPVAMTKRRSGDPAVLVADSSLLRSELNWRPRYADLRDIVETAWNWELNRRY